MKPIFNKFERCFDHAGVPFGPTRQAELLGMSYRGYASYRSDDRPLPLSARRHMEAIMLLPDSVRLELMRRHVPIAFGIVEDEL